MRIRDGCETFFRGNDAALGRFMQVDPLASLYNSHSPYHFAYNNPVMFNDPFGAEADSTGYDGGGGTQRFGPGSGNHWSDQYRSVAGNYMMMSTGTFQSFYGTTNADGSINYHRAGEIAGALAVGGFGASSITTPERVVMTFHGDGTWTGGVWEQHTSPGLQATLIYTGITIGAQQGNDYPWYHFFADGNPGGDFLYELNKWNPIANAYNALSTYTTGRDSYGVEQSSATATIQLASAIPIFKLSSTVSNVSFSALRQGIAKTLSNPNNIAHIMAAKHNLGPLVLIAGSEANMVRRLYLSLGQSGSLPASGTFEVTTAIYGSQVTIRGAVVNGVPRIGTGFIP